jgi:hypothetical protein
VAPGKRDPHLRERRNRPSHPLLRPPSEADPDRRRRACLSHHRTLPRPHRLDRVLRRAFRARSERVRLRPALSAHALTRPRKRGACSAPRLRRKETRAASAGHLASNHPGRVSHAKQARALPSPESERLDDRVPRYRSGRQGGADADNVITTASLGVSERVPTVSRGARRSSAAIVCSTVAWALAPVRKAVARGVGDASARQPRSPRPPTWWSFHDGSVGRINRGDVAAGGLRLGEVRSER